MTTSRALITRLLSITDFPAIVPRLQPDVLHRVIQTCGLEDCAELLAYATPAQIARVLDSDVWHADKGGADEAFDPERFGLWLSVLVQSGVPVAAEKLAGLEIELLIAGLAQHVTVFEYRAAASYTTLDGEHVRGRSAHDGLVAEIGGYLIEGRRSSAWDAIVDVLVHLEAAHSAFFHRLMRGGVRMSNGPREQDGFHSLLDDRDQGLFDLARDRDARRERHAYVTPADARAFLREGRHIRLDAEHPPQSALARACLRDIERAISANPAAPSGSASSLPGAEAGAPSQHDAEGVAAIIEVLEEAGLFTPPPRRLLRGAEAQEAGLAFIQAYAESHITAAEELAYIANAILAGCSIQRRAFTHREASDCAASSCNLGLQHWPPQWEERSLIVAFQVGWTILHRDVCVFSAKRLIDVLASIRCLDRDIQLELDALRHRLTRDTMNREPWCAGDALDAILALDASSWAALRASIDECPVVHAAVGASRQGSRAVLPTDFAFISQRSQISAVHEFLKALPSLLTS